MLELRKMNYIDIKQQWEYVTALPADENGLTNPNHGYAQKVMKLVEGIHGISYSTYC